MIVKKVYNNNIVLVEDEKQLEMILIGRGISFGKKAGDFMDAGKASLKTIYYYENIWLPEDEAGYIALHFVNATQNGEEMETTIQATKMVQDVLRIIQLHFNVSLDEKSLDYQRLVTHVRYFAHRFLVGDLVESDDVTLYEQVKALYPKCYDCVLKIEEYFVVKFGMQITKEEKMYLMLHIGRVVQRRGVQN